MTCSSCNTARLSSDKKKTPIKKTKIKQKSSKQAAKDARYSKVKMRLIKEAIDDESYYCRGCGNTHSLSLSHLIRRSRRSDLVDVEENMTFHCLVRDDGSKGCHDRWESITGMTDLKDFDKNMSIVLRLDPEGYWIIIHKLRDLGIKVNVNEHKKRLI